MKKETTTTIYELREDGIIYSKVKSGSYVGLEDTQLGLEIMKELLPKKKIFLISDISGIKGTSKEARKFSLDKEFSEVVGAIAFITGSGISKVVANFVLSMYKTSYGIKLFTNEEKALQWLNTKRDL